MEIIFDRNQRKLTWLAPTGTAYSVEAFSDVRNEINGERPDPAVFPDVMHGENHDRSAGPPVMPRAFPPGRYQVTAIEDTDERWLKPKKAIIPEAFNLVPVYTLNPDGSYATPLGIAFKDYGLRIHYANGSHHTNGCIGIVNEQDAAVFFLDLAEMLSNGEVWVNATT